MEAQTSTRDIRHGWLRDWRPRLTILALGLAGGIVLACGMLAVSAPPNTIPPDAASDFRLMAEAWNAIHRDYVDRGALSQKRLTYGAITGMADALGDTGHSRFLTPQMLRNQREATEGVLEGIGAQLQMKQNQVVIVAPIDHSPAQRAGLKPGDVILKVNGEPINGLPLDQVVGRIAGAANTAVQLTILTPRTEQTREVRLIRTRITLNNVTWHRLPGTSVAHVRIASFSRGVSGNLRNAMLAIRREGLAAVILDLRNNPGGLFDEAVKTASQFLASGDVVREKDSSGKVTRIPVRAGGVAVSIPMVGLINEGTASAAEIVAGALEDSHRAPLVGEKSFGTGTLLEVYPLSDGSALMLATKEWLTPAGHLIWHQGISPDVTVRLSPDANPLTPEAEQGMTAAGLQSSGDAQLLRALDMLRQRLGPEVMRSHGGRRGVEEAG